MSAEHVSDLPAFYRDAERAGGECHVVGCTEERVRGITVCPRHEHQWDNRKAERSQAAWSDFLRSGSC